MRHCLCLMVSRLAVLSCLWCQRNPQVHAPEDTFLMVAWTSLLTCSSCQLHNHTVKEPPALYCITFTVCFALYCITHYTLHIIYSPCYTAVCRVTLIKMYKIIANAIIMQTPTVKFGLHHHQNCKLLSPWYNCHGWPGIKNQVSISHYVQGMNLNFCHIVMWHECQWWFHFIYFKL